MPGPRNIPEAYVAWLWSQQPGRTLTTTESGAVRVIYPGRRHGSWGPDFHGALLSMDGSLVRGDVEIHVRGSAWDQHRHNVDPAYAGVVLHVVFAQGPRPLALRPDGSAIPTVELSRTLDGKELDASLQRWAIEGSRESPLVGCLAGADALSRLDRAGLARFRSKAARFEGDFTCVPRAQALWAGLLEALGYAANVGPFRLLADRVSEVAATLLASVDGPLALQALLLGESGLLPSQRGDTVSDVYAEEIERLWASFRRSGPRDALGWRSIGVRPGNGPVRRVVAAAQLVADQARWPIEESARSIVSELPPRKAALGLARLFERQGDDYWATHYDFGRRLARPAALLGQQRARDMVVNVLLPWMAALGAEAGEPTLEESVSAVYAAHPPLASNQITRHMARQILGSGLPIPRLSAQQQQGLIQIYRGWCDDRDCGSCPAGPHAAVFAAGLLAQPVC